MELRRLIITNAGQELMARVLSGDTIIEFTKIAVSNKPYTDAEILPLVTLAQIKQENRNITVDWKGNAAMQVQTAFENSGLLLGYNIYTFGLYARGTEEKEILFAAASANVPAYMPAYNGITVSGINVKLTFAMSNADCVHITVDPAAVATIGDIQILQMRIKTLEARVKNNGTLCIIHNATGIKYEIGMDSNGVYIVESEDNPDMVILKTKMLDATDTVAATIDSTTYGIKNASNGTENISEGDVVFSVVD